MNTYNSIVEMPMIAWHYFYKNYTIHQTLKSEEYILNMIEFFKDNETQAALWQMNLKIFKAIESGASFLDNAYGYLLPSNDYSESAAEKRSLAINSVDKLLICENTYKSIISQLQYKGLQENKDLTFFIIQLKGYCNAMANDLPIDIYANYFNSTLETESYNVKDCEAWINRVDLQFYELCENIQADYARDVKQLSIIEFFTRIKVMQKNSKKNEK